MPLITIEHHHYDFDEQRLQHAADLLLRPLKEKIMSQLDDLTTILSAIHDDVTSLLGRAQNLEDQLTTLQQTSPPQVDLTSAISQAGAIRQQLEGTQSTTAAATGNDVPAQEPPVSTDASTGDQTTATNTVTADITPAAATSTQPA